MKFSDDVHARFSFNNNKYEFYCSEDTNWTLPFAVGEFKKDKLCVYFLKTKTSILFDRRECSLCKGMGFLYIAHKTEEIEFLLLLCKLCAVFFENNYKIIGVYDWQSVLRLET